MKKEIKIRLKSLRETEKVIVANGGKYVKDSISKFTYFNQPRGLVLKITENELGNFLVRIQNDGQHFMFLSSDTIDNVDKTRSQLSKELGLKKELNIKKRSFALDKQTVELIEIDELGFFLVMVGDDPDPELAKRLSGLKNPVIITESFDNI